MSILIKGMTIPKAGGVLLFIDASGIATEGVLQEIAPTLSGRECEYEVIEIPPHGRLIDADALYIDTIRSYDYAEDYLELIEDMPTIIEAEE